MGYSPWGHKEADRTEQLDTHALTELRNPPYLHYWFIIRIQLRKTQTEETHWARSRGGGMSIL